MVGLIPRHFQSVTPCDSPSYLSCLSDRFGHRSYLSHSGPGALQCVRRVVVTCYEYYAKCIAFCIRQCHTLRLAIARLPIRLLDPWLDTVQPRPKTPTTRPASRRHIPESRHCDAGCLLAFRMVGLIPRHFQSVTPCDSPSYLSCLSRWQQQQQQQQQCAAQPAMPAARRDLPREGRDALERNATRCM